MDAAISINGVPIRLTEERWYHITEVRDELAGHYDEVLRTVSEPDFIMRGYGGALIAMKGIAQDRYLAVVYKEVSREDGFIITAYPVRRVSRRAIIWRRNR